MTTANRTSKTWWSGEDSGRVGARPKGRRVFSRQWPQSHVASALVFVLFILSLHTVSGIMCVQCDTGIGDPLCENDPPPPENCTSCQVSTEDGRGCAVYSHYNYCVTVRKLDENDTLLEVSRSCSPVKYSNSCSTGTDSSRNGMEVTMCSTFCAEDGCNHACAVYPSLGAILVVFVANCLVKVFKEWL